MSVIMAMDCVFLRAGAVVCQQHRHAFVYLFHAQEPLISVHVLDGDHVDLHGDKTARDDLDIASLQQIKTCSSPARRAPEILARIDQRFPSA